MLPGESQGESTWPATDALHQRSIRRRSPRMEQGQALQLPVLRQITPYLRPGVSSATFQSGELKGRLAGGIFRIQRLTLVGDFLKLLIQGNVTVAGNLDLDVIAQTGLFCLNPSRQTR